MMRVLGGRWFGWAMLGATFFALSACEGESTTEDEDGDDDDDSGGFCGTLASRFSGCGMGAFLSEFDDCEEPDDDEGRCTATCIVTASCDDLRSAICFGVPPALDACLEGCVPPPFTCGSGEVVPEDWLCDGFPDCFDGSDEALNCPTCDNGMTPLPDYARCDSYPDCVDGRDEQGCPTFTCNSGERLPDFVECDFYRDCADGSDEHAGCPDIFVCRNGEVVPSDWECDGYPYCLDGSDEHAGCPTVTCNDGTTTPGERCDGTLDCFDASDEPATCPPTPQEEICGMP